MTANDTDQDLVLATRSGLPDDQLFLARQYPREDWLSGEQLSEMASFWLDIHRYFRLKSEQLEKLINSVRNGEREAGEILAPFRSAAGSMLSHLEGHHNIEDHNYFPHFIRIEPRLARGFELMDADHHVIHDAIHALAGESRGFLATAAAQDGASDALKSQTDRLGDTISRFRHNMLRHLDDEEDLVIPLIIDRHLG